MITITITIIKINPTIQHHCNLSLLIMILPFFSHSFWPCDPGTSDSVLQEVRAARAQKQDLIAKLSVYTSVDNQTVLKHENGQYKVLLRSSSPWNLQVQWDSENLGSNLG